MKKLFLIAVTTAVLSGMLLAGTITVTSPAPGTAWEKGMSHTIRWTSSGCSDPAIKINIFRNSIAEANFVEQLTCTGCTSKLWNIPASYTNGNYVIRVKTADNACVGDSGVFSITGGVPEPPRSGSITVTRPNASDKWLRGRSHNITWTSSGTLDRNVKINIFRNSISEANFVEQLTAATASGSKAWNIPASYEPGNYYVRIKTNDNLVQDDSDRFEVTRFSIFIPGIQILPIRAIHVVEPNGGRTMALNSRIRILWRVQNLTNNQNIYLMKNGERFGVIAENLAPGRINYDWTVGQTLLKTALPGSGFKIRVEESGTGVFDESDNPFSIEEEKHVDLSCYISGHRSADHGRMARITVKVRVNNIGTETLRNVPVRVTVRIPGGGPGETKSRTIPEVTYRGHSYEYSLEFNFRLHEGSASAARRQMDREAVVVVDPDDIFRDVRRLNNTSTYNFVF